jgi:hypothetical protein
MSEGEKHKKHSAGHGRRERGTTIGTPVRDHTSPPPMIIYIHNPHISQFAHGLIRQPAAWSRKICVISELCLPKGLRRRIFLCFVACYSAKGKRSGCSGRGRLSYKCDRPGLGSFRRPHLYTFFSSHSTSSRSEIRITCSTQTQPVRPQSSSISTGRISASSSIHTGCISFASSPASAPSPVPTSHPAAGSAPPAPTD